MKKQLSVLMLAVAFGCVMGASSCRGQSELYQLEGSKPYTPSRLEWLAVDMMAQFGGSRLVEDRFLMLFVANHRDDTIEIWVHYRPDVDRETMNHVINRAKESINVIAQSKGWDSWLKVQEKVKMVSGQDLRQRRSN